jgi:hypothetical protein
MTKIFFTAVIYFLLTNYHLISIASVTAQTIPPAWINDTYRYHNYPADEWYIGFMQTHIKSGDKSDDALKSLERDAQNQLAESIIVKVESTTNSETRSQQYQSESISKEIVTSDYQQAVRTATSATTVKTEMKSYYDPSTGDAYAFAAVKRSDLAAFYPKQIGLDLNKVDVVLGVAEQLVASGKKMSARRKCQEAEKTLANVAYYQDLLMAVNADASDDELQIDRSNDLQSRVSQSLIDLEQSTFVYVVCGWESKGGANDAFTEDPGIICDIVKSALSENDCSVTDNPSEADYKLTLIGSTTQRSDGTRTYGILTYYANVRGSLYNNLTRKKTVDFSILNDSDAYADGKSPETAATKAFKLPSLKSKIMDKVLGKIKN